MRISDWSSDVCSSDLARRALRKLGELRPAVRSRHGAALAGAAFVPRHRPVACLWAAVRREPGGRAMIWVWILLAAALTWGGIVWIGRLPKTARPLAGAAIMLGIAGYALQGSPALPGHPVAKEGAPESFGEALTDTRQGKDGRASGRERVWQYV